LASMVPVSGSAYTYTYAVMGELLAWMVGWALVLEYAVAASAVSVGWSGYFVGLMRDYVGIAIPPEFANGPYAGGIINIPALVIALLVTGLLMIGTKESARFNALLVCIKVAALTAFVIATIGIINTDHFTPFTPNGWGIIGVGGAAASIFFAYVGFDAVSTAAEETQNPQRNVPIGLIGSLVICTVFYLLVAAGVIGTADAQPVRGAAGEVLSPGSLELANQCKAIVAGGLAEPVACSKEALAYVLKSVGWQKLGAIIGLAAGLALPSVVLMMLYGQTRVFFVMARDGLLPEKLAAIHPKWKTPHIVTAITGVAVAVTAALLPVGKLADVSNSGTLFAFLMVAIAVLVLRRTQPDRRRPFKTPAVGIVAPLAIIGCVSLYLLLPFDAKMVLPIWGGIGLLFYFLYGYRKSHVGRGLVEVHEEDADVPPQPVPPSPHF
jgi:basic amino acid/polyamine antiporter, APA family